MSAGFVYVFSYKIESELYLNSNEPDAFVKGAKSLRLVAIAAALIGLAAFAVYDHAVMRRNFRDLFTLILKQSAPTGAKPGASAAPKMPLALDTSGLPALGEEGSPLELTLVSDFECAFCVSVGAKSMASLRNNFVDRGLLRIYYLSMPLASHKNGQEAALAAFAALAQGKFWEMYDELFSGAPLGKALYEGAAARLGLDLARFKRDMSSAAIKAEAKRHIERAESLHLPGVPAIVFDGEILVGDEAWASLEARLSAKLTATAAGASVKAFGMLARLPGAVVLDVRTPAEFASGAIPGAVNVDVNAPGFLDAVAKAANKDAPLLVYCKSGKRSAIAWHMLSSAGFGSAVALDGGIDAWNAAARR